MEIRIGVVDSTKEISLETKQDLEALISQIDQALKEGSGVLWLEDDKGRRVGVPSSKVSYVEIDPENEPRPVGFRP